MVSKRELRERYERACTNPHQVEVDQLWRHHPSGRLLRIAYCREGGPEARVRNLRTGKVSWVRLDRFNQDHGFRQVWQP